MPRRSSPTPATASSTSSPSDSPAPPSSPAATTPPTPAIARGAPLIVSRRVAFPIRSRWKYSLATRYIAISGHVKATLIAGGVDDARITVVHDGVPLLEPAHGEMLLAVSKIERLL